MTNKSISDVLREARRVVIKVGSSLVTNEGRGLDEAAIGEWCRQMALLAREPGVSLCYQRPRVLPDWPYNLFCSIRGCDHDEVRRRVEDLRTRLGLSHCSFDLLFSIARPT